MSSESETVLNMSTGDENCICTHCKKTKLNDPDYYWRDYTGVVPHDAIPGGHDINNKTTYIGQAFYSRAGILPGNIYSDKFALKVAHNGSNLSDVGVKILCSPNENCFSWENAESTTLHLTTIDKHLVAGGHEDGKIVNIGRAKYQGEVIVGKIHGFEAGKARLFFVHGDKEFSVTSYQVLVYTKEE